MTTDITGDFNDSFFLQVGLGNVPGYSADIVMGVQDNLDTADGNITVWDNKFDYTPFTADTEMFISSSDDADTHTVMVVGLDSNFDPKVSYTALTGQTQVTAGNFRHVQAATVLAATIPAGDVYVAATDTLTAGVPDTDSKVKSKIIQGRNTTHNGFFMVPRGKVIVITALRATTDSATKPAAVQAWLTLLGYTPINLSTYNVMAGFPQVIWPIPVAVINGLGVPSTLIPEKTFMNFKALVGANDTQIFFGLDFFVIDKALTELA